MKQGIEGDERREEIESIAGTKAVIQVTEIKIDDGAVVNVGQTGQILGTIVGSSREAKGSFKGRTHRLLSPSDNPQCPFLNRASIGVSGH